MLLLSFFYLLSFILQFDYEQDIDKLLSFDFTSNINVDRILNLKKIYCEWHKKYIIKYKMKVNLFRLVKWMNWQFVCWIEGYTNVPMYIV